MTPIASSRAAADLALAVYLEPHFEGRRALLLGEARGVLAERFDRLAAQLEIIDPGARAPSRGEVPELPFDDRTFDLVLVCDVSTLPEPTAEAMRELHRVLARTGLLVVASPAQPRRRRRGPAPQVALDSLLSSEFGNVRVLAQAPLSGYVVGELERRRGEEFTIDSSLQRDARSEPERLLGLASEARLPLEPRLWIELPPSAVEARDRNDEEPQRSVEARGAEREQSQAVLVEELRRAEDEAREALHRESDLLRKLETERRARLDAEQLVERARSLERKLLAAEADYDDAVARVRYFESAIGEHEAQAAHDRERREASERELSHLKSELAAAAEQRERLSAERDQARVDFETSAREIEQQEERLVELGKQLLALEQENKRQAGTARDLLEELRRLERDKSAAVEHDARVAELEAERDRAVARALEAEVARESAQMRADELRSELEELSARRPEPSPRDDASLRELREVEARDSARERNDVEARDSARERNDELESGGELGRLRAEQLRQRGETQGLRLRLNEAELALEARASPGEELARATQERAELRLRLGQTEAALHALREAAARAKEPDEAVLRERERLRADARELARSRASDEELQRERERAHALERELVEARAGAREPNEQLQRERDRLRALELELAAAEQRAAELGRELEEADRFTELHAEDAERLANTEAELEQTRGRLDDLEEVLSALEEELRVVREALGARAHDLAHAREQLAASAQELARSREQLGASQHELSHAREQAERAGADAFKAAADAAARQELAERREAERDDVRAALADARSILAQLAGQVGADANDPPSIVQALLSRRDARAEESERAREELRRELAQRDLRIEQLRSELGQRDGHISQLERWLSEARNESDRPAQDADDSPEHLRLEKAPPHG